VFRPEWPKLAVIPHGVWQNHRPYTCRTPLVHRVELAIPASSGCSVQNWPLFLMYLLILLGFVASVPVGLTGRDVARPRASPHLMTSQGPSTTGSDGVVLLAEDHTWPPGYCTPPVPLPGCTYLRTSWVHRHHCGVPVLHTSLTYTGVPRPEHVSPNCTQRQRAHANRACYTCRTSTRTAALRTVPC